MTHSAYIYDAIRTPRSKGKKDGALHEVKPIELGAGLLTALQQRNDLDTAYVDDVLMGCVSPVGEQGSDMFVLQVLWHSMHVLKSALPNTPRPFGACSLPVSLKF